MRVHICAFVILVGFRNTFEKVYEQCVSIMNYTCILFLSKHPTFIVDSSNDKKSIIIFLFNKECLDVLNEFSHSWPIVFTIHVFIYWFLFCVHWSSIYTKNDQMSYLYVSQCLNVAFVSIAWTVCLKTMNNLVENNQSLLTS